MAKPGPCVSWAKTSSFMTHFYTNILPPRSSLTFLNTRGAQANILIYRANLSVGLKDTALLLRAATKQREHMEQLKAVGKVFYILPMHLHSNSYSLLTSFLSVMVVASTSTLLDKAPGVVVQKRKCQTQNGSLLFTKQEGKMCTRNMNKWIGFNWYIPPRISSGPQPGAWLHEIRKKTTLTAISFYLRFHNWRILLGVTWCYI